MCLATQKLGFLLANVLGRDKFWFKATLQIELCRLCFPPTQRMGSVPSVMTIS